MYRIELWMHGMRVIRSEPISDREAEQRIEWWKWVFGRDAQIKCMVADELLTA